MSRLKYFQYTIWITLVAAFFIQGAPESVQTLDTGELVTNAHLLRTIHPPGYPLYGWAYHLFTNLFPLGSVFFKASLLTICFSVLTLSIMMRFLSKAGTFMAIAITLLLASTPLFWKYSLLPDVFMLHLLIVSGISYIYLHNLKISSIHIFTIAILFALGLANHLTIIFLFPIVLDLCWKKISAKKVIMISATALVVFVTLYLSLLLFDHSSLTSWGNLDSLEQVISHFLRKDYGTFQLHSSTNPKFYLVEILSHFFYCSNLSIAFFAIFALLFVHKLSLKNQNGRRLLIYSLSLAFYLFFFFSLANIKPVYTGAEVLERFYLMPIIMIVFIGAYGFSHTKQLFSQKAILLLGILSVFATIYNVSTHHKVLDYSNNSIIEDWAINRLNSIESDDTILLEISDTGLFSLYYTQSVLKVKPEIPVVSYSLLYHKWYYQKVLKRIPTLVFEWEKFHNSQTFDLQPDLLQPNIEKHSFNMSKLIVSTDNFHVTMLGLGNTIKKGQGVSFSNDSLQRLKFQKDYPLVHAGDNYNQFAAFYAQYVSFFTLKAAMTYEEGKHQKAISHYKNALKVVPFCSQAFESICLILKETDKPGHEECYSELETNFSPVMKEYF